MLKKLILENWKSFRYAELPIDPLTVLVGTNASGKSNALDAFQFLRRVAEGIAVSTALQGDANNLGIRGGGHCCTLQSETFFRLSLLIQGDEPGFDYRYSIQINSKELTIEHESLLSVQDTSHSSGDRESDVVVFETQHQRVESHDANILNFRVNLIAPVDSIWKSDFSGFGGGSAVSSYYSFLPRLASKIEGEPKALHACRKVLMAIRGIFLLNPEPPKMRGYSPLLGDLREDASNIAGVIAASPQKEFLESSLSKYLKNLPENEIESIWSSPVGELSQDAMLYCLEKWPGQTGNVTLDARGMSDGSLHIIAVITALLVMQPNSQLVIDEVDSRLHPSRAKLLLKVLQEVSYEKKLDILVTTHNPALLDSLEQEHLPFVIVAHRDSQTGESLLTPLDKLENLPKLLASASLGDLVTQGAIERNLGTEAIAP